MPAPNAPFTPYAAQHANLNGPDDARPSALQIIEDEGLVNGLVGHVALVTGCKPQPLPHLQPLLQPKKRSTTKRNPGTSGIGPETARALYAAGMTVYMTARTTSKGLPVLSSLRTSHPTSKGQLHLLEMDLSSLDSVRQAASQFLASSPKLSILVCNAGVMAIPTYTTTTDGHETQFGVNHLAHFLLLQLLLPALLAGSSPEHHSRVIMVSSSGHQAFHPFSTADENPYTFNAGASYTPWSGYGLSKTANIWTANQLDRLYSTRGVNGYSLHPGGIATELQRHVGAEQLEKWKRIPGVEKQIKSAEQGAATSVWAAVGKCWEGSGGVYLEDVGVAVPRKEVVQGGGAQGFAEWVYDEEGEGRLWGDSLGLVGLGEA